MKKAPNKLSFEINENVEFPFEETKTKHCGKNYFVTSSEKTRGFGTAAHTRF